ncbi:alpha/beta hydrolase [Rhizobium sp. C1]|uniref:alpha/beta hydrolase n=1 Tax=Rhizobium sp. C1 TaxID=1349799 RepID=UPI001E417A3F|nr:alpha/beta hydrolase [Rhizobium sp. C1]MCD2178011.1 alpha/beta hydrolase [Rhizobium sp. C1]
MTTYHAFTKAPAPGAPLIFAFHGTGGNEFQFNELIGEIRSDAGIVAPGGDVSEHGALRFFRRTGEGVYDMDDLKLRTERMAAFVAAQKEAHPGHPLYGLGYSNGANILASVMFEHPDLFEKVALLHPLIPWEPEANEGLNGKQVLITAGERDPICPLPLTQRLISYFGGQGSRVEAAFHPGGHEIRQGELQALAQFLGA